MLFNRLKLPKRECKNKEGTILLTSSVTQSSFPGEKLSKLISLYNCRIFFILYGSNAVIFLSFSGERMGGKRCICWAAVQKESSKAWEGLKGALLLQVTRCGETTGNVSIDKVWLLSKALSICCAQHSCPQSSTQSSFHSVWEKQIQESLSEGFLTSYCSSCDLFSS